MDFQPIAEGVNLDPIQLQRSFIYFSSSIDSLSNSLSQLHQQLSLCTIQFPDHSTPGSITSEHFNGLTSRYHSIALGLSDLKSAQQAFYEHLNSEATVQFCIEKLSCLVAGPVTAENLLHEFKNLTGIQLDSVSRLYLSVKDSVNLIRNPFGADGTNEWRIQHGGNGVICEATNTFKEKPFTLVTSYSWSILEQTVVVPAGAAERLLVLGAACKRRDDCGAEAKVVASVLGEELLAHRELGVGHWEIMKVEKRIGGEGSEVVVKFMGKDMKNWAGHYGARFGYCFAVCFNL